MPKLQRSTRTMNLMNGEMYCCPQQISAAAKKYFYGRDKRIFSTGCADENSKMTDCYFEKKDWRLCKQELETFRKCWAKHENNERTSTKNA
ncbi:hypothetical protein ACMFMF_006391 [Clarireedia jacksonii]